MRNRKEIQKEDVGKELGRLEWEGTLFRLHCIKICLIKGEIEKNKMAMKKLV